MELIQDVNLKLNNNKENFLNSTLWKTINNGIDIGLRYALPDLVEDEVINLKDNLINFGLREGIKKSIDSVIKTGKEALGVFSENFQNTTQLETVIKNGGIIDKVSEVMDFAVNKAEEAGKISSITSMSIKKGKDSILNSIERNIEATLTSQINSAKNIDNYINNWNNYYNEKDFDGMQKEYNKIQKEIKELVPLENTIKNARYVENIHNLIKNNGKNFELTEQELELAGKIDI